MHRLLKLAVAFSLLAGTGCGGEKGDEPDISTAFDITDVPGDSVVDAGDAPDLVPGDGPLVDLAAELAPADTAPEQVDPVCTDPEPGHFANSCAVGCQGPEECGEGNLCLYFEHIDQHFCAIGALPGQPSCPVGYYQGNVSGTDVCVPYTPDCTKASIGVSCDGEDLAGVCRDDAPHCTSRDWRPGYCTQACNGDADCPGMYGRCLPNGGPCQPENLCRAIWEEQPEGCGVASTDANGDGAPCRNDDDCAASQVCFQTDDLRTSPFCTTPCGDDADCAPQTTCADSLHGTYCLPQACLCHATGSTMIRQLLDLVGLHPCEAGFRREWVMPWGSDLGHDEWRLPHFHAIHDYPPNALPLVKADIHRLDKAAGPSRVATAIESGAEILVHPLRPDDLSALASFPGETSIVQVLQTLAEALGEELDSEAAASACAQLPAGVEDAIVPVVEAVALAALARHQISTTLGDASLESYLFDLTHGFVIWPKSMFALPPTNLDVRDALTGKFDFGILFTAGAHLAQTIASAKGSLPKQTGDFLVTIETSIGLLVFAGTGDDAHDLESLGSEEIALLVDYGGDDHYLVAAGANVSLDNPVSVLLDLGGNDIYSYLPNGEEPPSPLLLPADKDGRHVPTTPANEGQGPISLSDRNRQGCGRMGIGMLYDFGEGLDTYQSLRISQGVGLMGLGVLYDGGGNDIYQAEAVSQGAAIFGMGILMDEGGDDSYSGFHAVQGFAYASSYSLLYDAAGNDQYTAYLGDEDLGGYPIYFNPQNPGKSNSSMSQGFGFGRRADFTDGVFMSGGFGTLRDLAGNDNYEADIFGQGAGYWFGSGILADGGGADHYRGRWYVLGAGAHYATGIFLDDGTGNDVYNQDLPLLNASVGMGHDWSLGIFEDAGGDDTYWSPSLASGAGNADGFGYFIDRAGDDTYSSYANNTYGSANAADYGTFSVFTDFDCIGLFLDADGSDTYDRPDMSVGLGDNSTWVNPPPHPDYGTMELGAGMDSTGVEPGM